MDAQIPAADLSTEKQPTSEVRDVQLNCEPAIKQGLGPWLYVLAGFLFYVNTS